MSGEGIRCPWARITGSCEAPNSAGNWKSKPYIQPWITLSFKLSQILHFCHLFHYFRTRIIFFPDSTNTVLFLASLTFAHYFYNVINILLSVFLVHELILKIMSHVFYDGSMPFAINFSVNYALKIISFIVCLFGSTRDQT